LAHGQSRIEKPLLTNRFVEALGYAAELHLHQRRKGKGQPYVGHLLGVAAIVIHHGGGEDEVIAALLHDAVEDQGGLPRLDEIRGKFGADYRLEGDAVFGRFQGRKQGTLWYYRTLVNVFRKAGSNPLIDELDRVVTELESVAK
jgi:hypothetical protein